MTALDLPLLVALLVIAWLTAGSTAVRAVSRIWLRHWAERRLRGAPTAITYLERPQQLLAAAAAGVALVLVLSGVLLGARVGGAALVGAVALYIALVVVAGQIIPRILARRWAPAMVPWVMPVLRAAEVTAAPFVFLGRTIASRLERSGADEVRLSHHDSIQELLREGEIEGVGEHDEIAIISGVVQFGEKLVEQVMAPRDQIFAVATSDSAGVIASRIAQSAYSRVPIYTGSIDNIVGVVLAFDVLKSRGEAVPPVRPVTMTTPDVRCSDLLSRMLRERMHIAVVRDDSGRTVGLVTLEDLLEELVGDIRDEHDEPEPPQAMVTP